MKLLCSLFLGLLATTLSVGSADAAWSLKGRVECPSGPGYPNVAIHITGTSCQGPFDVNATTDSFGSYALGLPNCNGTFRACIDPATLPPGAVLMSPMCVDFSTTSSNNDIDIFWIVNSSLCGGQNGACPRTQGYWKNHANV